MKLFTVDDLEHLSLGSAVLGSGGGGDPSYALLIARHHLEQYGPVQIMSLEELEAEDLVVPMGIMGAPLINMERILCGRELDMLLNTIEKQLRRKPTVIMAGEIGGANAFTPFMVAAKWGLPVLDADLIGRAFPQLHMNSCYLQNLAPTPAVLADCLGNTVVIETVHGETLEKFARSITVSMGSSSAIALYLMNGRTAQKAVVPETVSQALAIGKAIKDARESNADPLAALIQSEKAYLVGKGTLIDIDQTIEAGFLHGSVTIRGESGEIKIFYQNEYLLACDEQGETLASTPDILVLLEENSGTPITSEALRYGLQIALVAIPAPSIWQSEEGLNLVGPRCFGYEIEYRPVSQLVCGA